MAARSKTRRGALGAGAAAWLLATCSAGPLQAQERPEMPLSEAQLDRMPADGGDGAEADTPDGGVADAGSAAAGEDPFAGLDDRRRWGVALRKVLDAVLLEDDRLRQRIGRLDVQVQPRFAERLEQIQVERTDLLQEVDALEDVPAEVWRDLREVVEARARTLRDALDALRADLGA